MCMSSPKMPPPPKPADPVLPSQPIVQQNPAGLQVGRKDEDDATSKLKANKARKKLRIKRQDTQSVQTTATPQKASGVNVSG